MEAVAVVCAFYLMYTLLLFGVKLISITVIYEYWNR